MQSQIKMALKSALLGLNEVVTYGETSCENLVNAIKNIKTVVNAIEEVERRAQEAKDDNGNNEQGQNV